MDTKIPAIKIAEDIDWKKVIADLSSLKNLGEFARNNNWRFIVSGGYSLDMFLHLTTRTHNDVDIIIYGQENSINAVKKISSFVLSKFSDAVFMAKQESLFTVIGVSSREFGANIYFIETIEDPYKNHHKIKKPDGEVVIYTEHDIPKPSRGKIGDCEFEIEDQNAHLADILRKYKSSVLPGKYNQDVENLKHITDPQRVESLLNKN